jgi:hypothetical protein
VELKARNRAGVPLHSEPRGTNDFQRVPDGTKATVLEVAQGGRAELLDSGGAEGPVRHLYLCVDTTLHARVERAAMAAGVKMAPWLRAMVRQITLTDFPASWQEATSEERSHDSRIYDTRFMLRLDKTAQAKLQQLISHFGVSKANIIRRLIMQATDEDFPASWQMRAAERAMPPVRQQTRNHREMTR